MAQLFRPSHNNVAKLMVAIFASAPFILGLAISQLTRQSTGTKVGVPLDQPVPFSHKHHAIELGIDCRFCHTSVETSAVASVPPTQTCMTCHSQIWTNSPLLEPVRDSYRTGKPIQWAQVNKVPEFVFFNHSIHIDRGVNCNMCHGAIQKMQITAKGQSLFMSWCLECHREPEKFLYKDKANPQMSLREQVFEFYKKLQRDDEGRDMMDIEQRLLHGDNLPTNKDIAMGEELVKQYKVKKEQLTDCSICHH